MFGLTLLPTRPARTIFEFAPRRVFCTATFAHCFLARIHPAWACFVFRIWCGLTAAELLDLISCSSCLALSSVLSLSELPWHTAAKAFLWVAPATGDCHQYLSLLLHPYDHELPGLQAALHRQNILRCSWGAPVAHPLQVLALLVLSQRRSDLLRKPLILLLPW